MVTLLIREIGRAARTNNRRKSPRRTRRTTITVTINWK